MSASTLRAAAALIRERANKVSPSPWTADDVAGSVLDRDGDPVVSTELYRDPDLAHIASWHPDVALAVAHLIDTILQVGPVDGGAEWDATVTLARTYLGDPA